MTGHASTCRLCSREDVHTALTLRGMPRWNHRLLQEAELATDRGLDLAIQRCGHCGFVSLPTGPASEYYEDYVNAPSESPQMQAFLHEQAHAFVHRFALQGRAVLEVGCGDGGFLEQLRDAGARCHGIEPSRAQRDIARSRGFDVEEGVLSVERRPAGAPFDAFVTRQVFEHVEDIHGFLAAIRAHLTAQAVGLVEVPNLDVLLAEERFFDFIPEHVNYFSSRTLRLALEIAGFEVLSVDPVQDGEALRALVRVHAPPSLAGLGRRMQTLKSEIAGFVAHRRALGERVAAWGAGGKGLSVLAASGVGGIDLLVDGDVRKHGRYTPVSHLRVAPPSALREHDIGAVLILAPAYRREILRVLRTDYGFQGAVGVVGAEFETIEAPGRVIRGAQG